MKTNRSLEETLSGRLFSEGKPGKRVTEGGPFSLCCERFGSGENTKIRIVSEEIVLQNYFVEFFKYPKLFFLLPDLFKVSLLGLSKGSVGDKLQNVMK